MERLSPQGQAQVAAHWAAKNGDWNTALRPFSKQHLKNMGHAAGVATVAGGATIGTYLAATLPAPEISKEIGLSVAINAIVGTLLGLGVTENDRNYTLPAMGVMVDRLVKTQMKSDITPENMASGIAVSYISNTIIFRAKNAVNKAGGITEVWRQLRNNPVRSIQSDIQQTATGVFAFDKLPQDLTARAVTVQEIAPHLENWVKASDTFSPALRSKIREDLDKIFDSSNYNPEDWSAVEQAIAPARRAHQINMSGNV
jgi:hypothetical protein